MVILQTSTLGGLPTTGTVTPPIKAYGEGNSLRSHLTSGPLAMISNQSPMLTKRTMKSVRYHGRGDIRIDEIEEPKCRPGWIKMKPAYVGICGSDIHEYTGGPVLVPEQPHPITGTKMPVSMGHEFGGVIEEVGEGVTHLSPGQRAVVRPTIFDGTCPPCTQGVQYCCENIGFIGLSGYGGGMSEYFVAPAEHFYALPDSISLETAALIEPLAVAWHAIQISPFKTGDSALIVGAGPVGLNVVQILKLQGAKNIIVAEITENRKKLAWHYGATQVLDSRKSDLLKSVRGLTDDIGVDVVFDAAGVEKMLNAAIPTCRVQGTVVNIAVWEKQPHIKVNELMYHEVHYVGAALYDENAFCAVIKALDEGRLKPQAMITGKVPLDRVREEGFETLLQHRDLHCKLVVDVQGSG